MIARLIDHLDDTVKEVEMEWPGVRIITDPVLTVEGVWRWSLYELSEVAADGVPVYTLTLHDGPFHIGGPE